MQFPTVSGSNLHRKTLTLPQDFEGELNLVLIAFQRVNVFHKASPSPNISASLTTA